LDSGKEALHSRTPWPERRGTDTRGFRRSSSDKETKGGQCAGRSRLVELLIVDQKHRRTHWVAGGIKNEIKKCTTNRSDLEAGTAAPENRKQGDPTGRKKKLISREDSGGRGEKLRRAELFLGQSYQMGGLRRRSSIRLPPRGCLATEGRRCLWQEDLEGRKGI